MQEENITQNLECFRHGISQIPHVLEQPSDTWWRQGARMLLGLRNHASSLPNGTGEYYANVVEGVIGLLRKEIKMGGVPNSPTHLTDTLIMFASREMATRFSVESENPDITFVPWKEIILKKPDRFLIETYDERTILRIKRVDEDIWDDVLLPNNSPTYQVFHKGGPARYCLGVFAGAPDSMQCAETPFNDFDTIVFGDQILGKKESLRVGADLEGVEFGGNDVANIESYFLGRDTTQNEVLLGTDGIYYTEEAYKTAQTGFAVLRSLYIPHRAIYGIDVTYIDGMKIPTSRGMMRLVKALSEGKILCFELPGICVNFDMSIYTLFLANKWRKRDDFFERLDRLHYILKSIGQIKEEHEDPLQMLERMHQAYPFFNFVKRDMTLEDLVRWKSRKLARQLDREHRWATNHPRLNPIDRFEGDLVPKLFNMNGYRANTQFLNNGLTKRWAEFIRRCEQRNEQSQLEYRNASVYERLFGEHNVRQRYDDVSPD